jgi:hypothetical protein
VTDEFWFPKGGVTRCRACWNEYRRLRQRGYLEDEATRVVTRMKNRLHYAANREKYAADNAAWKAANRDRIRAYNAAYVALHKGDPAPMEAYRRDWPDRRPKRTDPPEPIEVQRTRWRESKRRRRAAA